MIQFQRTTSGDTVTGREQESEISCFQIQ